MQITPRNRWLACLPLMVILLSTLPLLRFLLPATYDRMSESYEPTKTLRFISTAGHSVHKWGPMPNFIYAPGYAALLTYSRLTGHLHHVVNKYPYGMDNPLQQITNMLLFARSVTLLIALGGIYLLTRTLQRGLGEGLGPPVAVMIALSTTTVFLTPLVDTKPDGLMIGLFFYALANYVAIVLEGWTLGRAIGLSLFYVASFSCKELTSTSMLLPYAGLFIASLLDLKKDSRAAHRDLYLFGVSVVCAIGFYLLVNVVYAPHTWVERMHYVFGPLKDPAIWAEPSHSRLSYAKDTLHAVILAIGWGGAFLFLLAALGSIRYRSYKLLLLWLPFVGHLGFTSALAGYMPAYFMLPLGPALCLPGAWVASQVFAAIKAESTGYLKLALVACTIACAWVAISATTVFRSTHIAALEQDEMAMPIMTGESVNIASAWPIPDSHFFVVPQNILSDRRPLYEVMQVAPASRPAFILIDQDEQKWLEDVSASPAREAMLLRDTGFDYKTFAGIPALGYSLFQVRSARLPLWCVTFLVAGSSDSLKNSVLVYRNNFPQQ